jgi:hypothetical protein
VIAPLRIMVAAWLRQIAVVREALQAMEREIAAVAVEQQDWALFRSLPGAGDRLAPRLMAAMGSNRDRFGSAAELQCFSGIAPVRKACGNTNRVHSRLACPKFLRQTFHEWAAHSRLKSVWAREFYLAARARGKSHHMAVRALAFKWIRILFRLLARPRALQRRTLCRQLLGARSRKESPHCAKPLNTSSTRWKTSIFSLDTQAQLSVAERPAGVRASMN